MFVSRIGCIERVCIFVLPAFVHSCRPELCTGEIPLCIGRRVRRSIAAGKCCQPDVFDMRVAHFGD